MPSAITENTHGAFGSIKGDPTLISWWIYVCEMRLVRPALLALGMW